MISSKDATYAASSQRSQKPFRVGEGVDMIKTQEASWRDAVTYEF